MNVSHIHQHWELETNSISNMKIKKFQSDNGGEFVSKNFYNFLHECGIQRQTNAPYTL